MTAGRSATTVDAGHPPRPPRCAIQWHSVSDFLIARAHWLMWRRELIWLEKTGEWKWTKVPLQLDRRNASSTDPKTWSDWESIQIAYDRDGEGDKFFDGIGFVLTVDLRLVGLDFDHCYDAATGNIDPTVAHFLRMLNSYSEITPGGDGFRVFAFGKLPPEGRKRGNFPQPGLACECYAEGRYLTVTGHRFGDATEIIENQAGIDEVHHLIFDEWLVKKREAAQGRVQGSGAAHLNLSDQQLLDLARNAANGAKFTMLYDGDWSAAGYASRSEADAALCNLLSFYTGPDHGRIDAIFRGSGLMREKWNRDDYRNGTITKALEGRSNFYSGAPPAGRDWDDIREGVHSGRNDGPLPSDDPPADDKTGSNEERPEVIIEAGKIPAMLDAAEAALLPHCERLRLFQSVDEIVQVIPLEKADVRGGLNRPAGAVQLIPMVPRKLQEIFDRRIKWMRWKKDKAKKKLFLGPADSFLAYAERYLSRRGEWRLPFLSGVIEAPTLRRDGSILQTPGYDHATALYLASSVKWDIPRKPTREDAVKALKVLRDPFAQFPWVDPVDEAVHLSAILTGLQRRQISFAPLIGYGAPAAGTGKSLLAESVGIIATGRKPTAFGIADDQTEFRKAIMSALREGHLIILLDNLADALDSPDLCRALTQSFYGDRLLGTNTTLRAPTNALWLATMNGFRVQGDMVRRALVCRIDAKREDPEKRDDFKIKDLPEYLLANRQELVTAVLTILRAFHIAGSPPQKDLEVFGGFEQWSREIRTPLIWLGLPDPCGSRKFVREGDSERDALGAVLAAWHDAIITDTLTVNEVIARTVKNEAKAEQERTAKLTALRDALLVVAAEYRDHDIIDPRRLGAWLADQGKTVDGLRFERAGKSHSAALWKVAVIAPVKLDEAGS